MNINPINKRLKQAGISIVEFMIAAVLSAVLCGLFYHVFYGVYRSRQIQLTLAEMQTTFASIPPYLLQEWQDAGIRSTCLNSTLPPLQTSVDAADHLFNDYDAGHTSTFSGFDEGIIGYEARDTGANSILQLDGSIPKQWHRPLPASFKTDIVAGSDVLLIKKIKPFIFPVVSADSHNIYTEKEFIQNGLKSYLLEDCASRRRMLLSYEMKNEKMAVGAALQSNQIGQTVRQGSSVQAHENLATLYFVRKDSHQIPGLYMATETLDGKVTISELFRGVENMQLTYQEETAAASQIKYKNAEEVTDWSKVNSIRAVFVIRSLSPSSDAVSAIELDAPDNQRIQPPLDKYDRRILVMIIPLKNRLPH